MYEGDSPLAERRAAALSLDPTLLAELLGRAELRELLDPAVIEQKVANAAPDGYTLAQMPQTVLRAPWTRKVAWDPIRDTTPIIQLSGVTFGIEPHVRFKGQVGEQATMFFRDPSGNALEFKAFADDSMIFATE